MDIGIITPEMWDGLTRLVLAPWLLVAFAVACGGSLLFALSIIPSLVTSGGIPAGATRFRGPLFAMAAISGLGMIAVLGFIVSAAGVINDFWPRWWI